MLPHPIKPLPFLPRIFFLTVLAIATTCTQQDQVLQTKDSDQNLRNTTTAFIYNMVPSNPESDISPEYNTAINTFSVKLLGEIYKSDTFFNKNVVVSPFSVSRNLAIITEATTGESKNELLAALGGRAALDDATTALCKLLYADPSVILQCADALWLDSNRYLLQPSFKELSNKKYGVEATGLNLADVPGSITTINSWIAANTNNRITNVVERSFITPLTALLITSTIYFEADWTSPFDASKTESHDFTTPKGTVAVPMMVSDYHHQTRKTSEYENVKLYYGTDDKKFFYLDIYMPTTISIEEFIAKKSLDALGNRDSMEYGGLCMPKFFFETTIDLAPVLKNMGVKSVFDMDKSEITGMVVGKSNGITERLFIEKIVHKAGIKTNEEGTVAYAVTISALGAGSAAPMSPDVVLDKPFVYFIRAGENGLVLFAGVVNDPGSSK